MRRDPPVRPLRAVLLALHPRTLWRRLRRTVPPEVAATAVSLLLAAILGSFALRSSAGFDEGVASPAPTTPYQAHAVVAPSQSRAGPAASARFDAAWKDARSRLGVPLEPPRVLPAGVRPFVAAWEPADPSGLHGEMLRAWYVDGNNGVVFELNIGVGVGVSAGCSPPDAHGSADLTAGTSVTWVRGYRWWDEDFGYRSERDPGACTLPDQWLRLGVAPGAGVGWRLLSHRLPLEELMVVASSLPCFAQPIGDATADPAGAGTSAACVGRPTERAAAPTVYIVESEARAHALRAGLDERSAISAAMGLPPSDAEVVWFDTAEAEARFRASPERNRMRVIDLRTASAAIARDFGSPAG